MLQLLLALPAPPSGSAGASPGGNANIPGAAVETAAGRMSSESEVMSMLESDGVFRLSAAEARELLASLHEDG